MSRLFGRAYWIALRKPLTATKLSRLPTPPIRQYQAQWLDRKPIQQHCPFCSTTTLQSISLPSQPTLYFGMETSAILRGCRLPQPVLEGPAGAGSIVGPHRISTALVGLIGLRARNPDSVSAPVLGQILDLNSGQFRAPEGAFEDDQCVFGRGG